MPILSSKPFRNFGRTFVPRRFQTSGGTSPQILNVRVAVTMQTHGCRPHFWHTVGCSHTRGCFPHFV